MDDASGVLSCTEQTVLIQDEEGLLSCLDLTGHCLWSQAVGRLHRGPAVFDSLIVVASQEPSALTALDRPTGRVLWRTAVADQPTTPPYIQSDTILLGTESGLQTRSLLDGSVLDTWEQVGGGVSSDLVVGRRAIAFVDLAGHGVFVSRQDGSVFGIHAGATPGIAPLRSRDRWLYAGSEGLMVLDPRRPADPPVLWANTSDLGEITAPPVLSGSAVYAGVAGCGLVRWGAAR
jgi:outer membrane protein assembly factor BamB